MDNGLERKGLGDHVFYGHLRSRESKDANLGVGKKNEGDPKACSLCSPAPLSIEFPRQEYWSGLPCPSPRDLPDTGIEPTSPALRADSLPTELLEKTLIP